MKEYISLLKNLGETLIKKGITDNTTWTYEIKYAFSKYLNENHKNLTIRSGNSTIQKNLDVQSGWLYDLTALNYDSEGYLINVYLALESEWGDFAAIFDDFEKLLQSTALNKLMIFNAQDVDEHDTFLTDLVFATKIFDKGIITGNYLLACWVNSENKFKFTRFPVK
jgi:hypothetical protein